MTARSTFRDLGCPNGGSTPGIGLQLEINPTKSSFVKEYRHDYLDLDPLASKNAYLSFCKLGVLGNSLQKKYYGDKTSVLHKSGSARMWIT
jgi:predicted GNAT superfamily acetyltransferase